MALSAAIRLNGGLPGVKAAVVPGGAVHAELDSTDGVGNTTWSIAGTDETTAVGDYTLTPSGPVNNICDTTALIDGTAALLKARVTDGVNYAEATVKFYVPIGAAMLEVGATGEVLESDATHGSTGIINAGLRAVGDLGAPGGVFLPESYGAVGDGITDDTVAIQAAIDAASANITVNPLQRDGGIVLFGATTYKMTTIELPSNVTLQGQGPASTLLHSVQLSETAGAIKLIRTTSDCCSHVAIRDLSVYADEGYCVYADPVPSAYDSVFTYDGAYHDHTADCAYSYGTPFVAWTGVADYLYLGVSTHPAHGVYNCVRAVAATTAKNLTLTAEYWNGAGWVSVPGWSSLHFGNRALYCYFANPVDWETTVVNAVTRHWLRVKTTSIPTAPVTLYTAFGRVAFNHLNSLYQHLRLSGGKEAIYLDRCYTQTCHLDDILVRYVGGGDVALIGNANVIERINQEGGQRSIAGGDNSDYRAPMAGICVSGTGDTVRGCVFEGITGPAVGYYCSGGDLTYERNWYEISGGGVDDIAWCFENVQGGRIDTLNCTTGTFVRFWNCFVTVGTLGSADQMLYLGDVALFDADDRSNIVVELALGNFIEGQLDNRRMVVQRAVSRIAPDYPATYDAKLPITGNLLPNGDFAAGLYGWTVTAEAGVVHTETIEDAGDGTGRRLKVVFSNGGVDALAVTISQNVAFDARWANGPGYFSYTSQRTSTARVLSQVAGVTTTAREQDCRIAVRAATIGSGAPSAVALLLYGDATGAGTIYIQDVQLTSGERTARVPDVAAQRGWPGGTTHRVATDAPATGIWQVADLVWHTAPAVAGHIGKVCTVAGTPGTWSVFGPVGLISDVQVDAAAAIAGTKVAPNFGTQNVVTTGAVQLGAAPPTTGRLCLTAADSITWAVTAGDAPMLSIAADGTAQLGGTKTIVCNYRAGTHYIQDEAGNPIISLTESGGFPNLTFGAANGQITTGAGSFLVEASASSGLYLRGPGVILQTNGLQFWAAAVPVIDQAQAAAGAGATFVVRTQAAATGSGLSGGQLQLWTGSGDGVGVRGALAQVASAYTWYDTAVGLALTMTPAVGGTTTFDFAGRDAAVYIRHLTNPTGAGRALYLQAQHAFDGNGGILSLRGGNAATSGPARTGGNIELIVGAGAGGGSVGAIKYYGAGGTFYWSLNPTGCMWWDAATTMWLYHAPAAGVPTAALIQAQNAGGAGPTNGAQLQLQGGNAAGAGTVGAVSCVTPLLLPSYTVASVPSAAGISAGGLLYVTNESGGAVPAFSDGTNWRRVTDRAIIS